MSEDIESSEAETTANAIAREISQSTKYVSQDDIRVTCDMAKYSPGTNRNAGPGKLAWWVFIPVPALHRDMDDSSRQKKIRDHVASTARTAASHYAAADYVGFASDHEGFDSSRPNESYVNIRINIEE